MTSTLLDAALEYAFQDLFVVPIWSVREDGTCACPRGAACASGAGKHPACANGLSDATTDEDAIRAWWTAMPDANIGIVLEPSGALALDVDGYHSDLDKLEKLEKTLGGLPDTVTQKSGSGDGWHILFKNPRHPVRGVLGGIVVRAKAYIVAAPSRHASGGRYEWVPGRAPGEMAVAELPEAWRAALEKRADVGTVSGVPSDEPPHLALVPTDKRYADARAHLLGEAGEVKGASTPGTTFNVVRSVIRGYGLTDPERALALVAEAYDSRCVPPWEERLGRHVWTAYERATTPAWGAHYAPDSVRAMAAMPERASAMVGAENVRVARDRAAARVAVVTGAAPAIAALPLLSPAALPAAPPTRLELRDHVLAAVKILKAKKDGPRKHQGTLLELAAKGWPLTDDPTEYEHEMGVLIGAVIRAAPIGTTAAQIAEFLLPVARGQSVGQVTTAVATALGGLPSAPGPARGSRVALDDLPDPEDDEELRAQLLPDKQDGVSACGANIARILQYAEELRGHVAFNELTKSVEVTASRFDGVGDGSVDVAVKNWLRTHWQIDAQTSEVGQQLLMVSSTHFAYNPVQQYLSGLAWDRATRVGGPDAPSWLTTYCGAEDTPYVRQVGAMFLVSAVARAAARLPTGAKVDTVLVLEAPQGFGKSRCCAILGGAYSSDTPLDLGNKDSYMVASRSWFVELAELASLSTREVESHKAFLSARVDLLRPPYGRVLEQFCRHCVFFGTTNEEHYLQDSTGNRRFLTVKVGRIDVDALARDRDQLWAEAVHRYASADQHPELAHPACPGERWWFEEFEESAAAAVVAERRVEDPWVSLIQDWVATQGAPRPGAVAKSRWTMAQVATGALNIAPGELQKVAKVMGRAMREAGMVKLREKDGGQSLWQLAVGNTVGAPPVQ